MMSQCNAMQCMTLLGFGLEVASIHSVKTLSPGGIHFRPSNNMLHAPKPGKKIIQDCHAIYINVRHICMVKYPAELLL